MCTSLPVHPIYLCSTTANSRKCVQPRRSKGIISLLTHSNHSFLPAHLIKWNMLAAVTSVGLYPWEVTLISTKHLDITFLKLEAMKTKCMMQLSLLFSLIQKISKTLKLVYNWCYQKSHIHIVSHVLYSQNIIISEKCLTISYTK